tara:strand:+ start:24 stop:302 length:279 start_codon:yes stop_codon:yes gene_type:complete
MGVSKKQLLEEKTTLKKTFDEIQSKLQVMQKEQEQYKNNLNAVGGALQQVEKLLSINHANWELEQKGIDIDTGKKLEIKEKEKPKLLNEGEK